MSCQDFLFNIAAPQCWNPSSSYFLAEVELLGIGAAAAPPAGSTPLPTVAEGIAFAEGAINNCYGNAYFTASGVAASQLTNFLGVGAQVKARTAKTGSWLQTVGKSAWGMTGSLSERIAAVSGPGIGPTAVAPYVDAPFSATVGLSGLDDCREVIARPTTAGVGDYSAAAVAVDINGVITGSATTSFAFAAVAGARSDVGATLVIEGQKFTISAMTTATVGQVSQKPALAIAATTNWYLIRRERVRSDQVRNKVQVLFRPPIGIMDYAGLLGAGAYKFSLTPYADFQQAAVETINPNPVVGTTYTFNVLTVKFYAAVMEMRIPDSIQTLHLTELDIQNKVMQSENAQLQFTVPASTVRIHIFLQDSAAGSTALAPPSRFTVRNGSDLNLKRIQAVYSNQARPLTLWNSQFDASYATGRNTAYLQQLYHQGLIENQMDQHSCESLDQWLTRGPMYSFRYERDAEDRSTEVQLALTYDAVAADGTPFAANSKAFIVAEYTRAVELTHDKGLIVAVRSLNV